MTLYFWIIKVLCTTVGETASDFLNVNLGLGLTGTSVAMGACLLAALGFQFRASKYIPGIYWLAVVLISVFGTLVTDLLTDSLGVPLKFSTAAFSIVLGAAFVVWYVVEKTLTIHSIFTRRREAFYWLAILITFALGTAAGDLMAEDLGFGYLVTGIVVCVAVAAVVTAWRRGLDSVLAFWIAYILTRPLGASLGDYLSQSSANGGLGLGASLTTVAFMLAIVAVVVLLTVTRRDLIIVPATDLPAVAARAPAFRQVVAVVSVIVVTSAAGYAWRSSQLEREARSDTSPGAPLGDMTVFRGIATDTLRLVREGSLPAARSKIADLETAWDDAEARLRRRSPEKWSAIDSLIDTVLRRVRSVHEDSAATTGALDALIAGLEARQGARSPAAPAPAPVPTPPHGGLGDLSGLRRIAQECLDLVTAGDPAGARALVKNLESAWDDAESVMKPRDPSEWRTTDSAIDRALSQLRSAKPDADESAAALTQVITRLSIK